MKKTLIVALIICLFLSYASAETPKSIDDYIALYNTWSLYPDTLFIENCFCVEIEEGIYGYIWYDDDNKNSGLSVIFSDTIVYMSYQCPYESDIGRFFKQAVSIILVMAHGNDENMNELYSYLLSGYFSLTPDEEGDYINCRLMDDAAILMGSYTYVMSRTYDGSYLFSAVRTYNPYYDDYASQP